LFYNDWFCYGFGVVVGIKSKNFIKLVHYVVLDYIDSLVLLVLL